MVAGVLLKPIAGHEEVRQDLGGLEAVVGVAGIAARVLVGADDGGEIAGRAAGRAVSRAELDARRAAPRPRPRRWPARPGRPRRRTRSRSPLGEGVGERGQLVARPVVDLVHDLLGVGIEHRLVGGAHLLDQVVDQCFGIGADDEVGALPRPRHVSPGQQLLEHHAGFTRPFAQLVGDVLGLVLSRDRPVRARPVRARPRSPCGASLHATPGVGSTRLQDRLRPVRRPASRRGGRTRRPGSP